MISAAWSSVTYMIMNRCGINAEKYLELSPNAEDKNQEENLKIDSLDDLFETEETPKKEERKVREAVKVGANVKEEAPVLPQEDFETTEPVKEDLKRSQEEIDIQKELEAKFDELFGPIDDEE